MNEIIRLLIGIVVLALGIPLGNYLKKITSDEIKSGQRWFSIVVVISLVIGLIGLILGDDAMMFIMFFIAIVSSRSVKVKSKKKN